MDHTSAYSFSQILFSVSEIIMEDVKAIVNYEKWYGLMIDESTDAGGWEEMAVFIRMWNGMRLRGRMCIRHRTVDVLKMMVGLDAFSVFSSLFANLHCSL